MVGAREPCGLTAPGRRGTVPARSTSTGPTMQILGLPWQSVLVLIVIPFGLVAYQYYVCWQIRRGRRD